MGPNGSGKSTLANVILNNPQYETTSGDILLDGESIMDLSTDKRAKKVFLCLSKIQWKFQALV